MSHTPLAPEDIKRLRDKHYNARVVSVRHVHHDLLVMRVRPDGGMFHFEPGQYTTLGLGRWEPRIDGIIADAGPEPFDPAHMIIRAYSISCPMLDAEGKLTRCADCDFLEFYVVLVRKPADDPPCLTPRLFALDEGDRLYVSTRPHGSYTLAPVGPDANVIFLATGTGEAPHNAMIAELLSRGHRGRIAAVTSVRYRRDLAYRAVHAKLQERFSSYCYVALTTREPYNVVPGHPQYVGKQHLQDYFASGRFSTELNWPLEPVGTHVYLCGNPAMIGVPRHAADGHYIFPEPTGMVEILVNAGFSLDEPHEPGNIHFEKYW